MISHGLFLPHVNIVLHKIDLEAHLDFRLIYRLYFISLHCLLLAVLNNSSHVSSNRSTGHFILTDFVLSITS